MGIISYGLASSQLYSRYLNVLIRLTASSDETVQISSDDVPKSHMITHPVSVRCILPLPLSDLAEPYLITGAGDIIRIYDISSLEEPDLIGEVDGHWHDVTALRLWMRKSESAQGRAQVEPWIISASLDGTIRKWRLQGRVHRLVLVVK